MPVMSTLEFKANYIKTKFRDQALLTFIIRLIIVNNCYRLPFQ